MGDDSKVNKHDSRAPLFRFCTQKKLFKAIPKLETKAAANCEICNFAIKFKERSKVKTKMKFHKMSRLFGFNKIRLMHRFIGNFPFYDDFMTSHQPRVPFVLISGKVCQFVRDIRAQNNPTNFGWYS